MPRAVAAPGKVVHEAWSPALLLFTSQHSRSDCRTILGLPAGLLPRWRRAGARGSRSSGRADLAFPWPGLRSAASGHSSLLGLRFAFQPPAVTRAAPSCSERGSGARRGDLGIIQPTPSWDSRCHGGRAWASLCTVAPGSGTRPGDTVRPQSAPSRGGTVRSREGPLRWLRSQGTGFEPQLGHRLARNLGRSLPVTVKIMSPSVQKGDSGNGPGPFSNS